MGGDDSLGAARGGWSYPPRALCPRSIVPLRLPIDDIPRALPVESRRRNKKNQTSCDDKASCNAAKETRKETQQKCSGPEGDHGRICLPLARNPGRPQARPQLAEPLVAHGQLQAVLSPFPPLGRAAPLSRRANDLAISHPLAFQFIPFCRFGTSVSRRTPSAAG